MYRGEQPCYLPLRDAATFALDGDPLDVETWLADAPGYVTPGFRCLHEHCSGRAGDDLLVYLQIDWHGPGCLFGALRTRSELNRLGRRYVRTIAFGPMEDLVVAWVEGYSFHADSGTWHFSREWDYQSTGNYEGWVRVSVPPTPALLALGLTGLAALHKRRFKATPA